MTAEHRPGAEPAAMERAVRAAVAARADRLIAFARDLVAIPTENPPGRCYRDCVGRIAAELAPLGATTRIVEVPGSPPEHPRYCLLASIGEEGPAFYLHGHYDVVPAADPGQFAARIEDGVLRGRGAADMKSGLAAMVHAMGALSDCGLPRHGRVVLVAVPDEETGGRLGAEWLGRSGLLDGPGTGCLVGEPTSGQAWIGHRGALSLRVTVIGRGAHGILQHEGVNAFEGLLRVGDALRELKAEVETRETRLAIEPRGARRSILMLGGECGSGRTFNTVPGRAWLTLDRRTNPDEDFVAEKERLLALFDRLRGEGLDIEVEILQESEPTVTAADGNLAETVRDVVAGVTGRAPAFTLCPGLIETRFYVRRGLPALAYGPGLLEVAHHPDESVATRSIMDCATIYALTSWRMLERAERRA